MTSNSQSSSAGQDSALQNIRRVIVLMFENRSFDHLLGAMPGVDGVLDPQGNTKPGLYNTMQPLAEPSAINPQIVPTEIVPGLGSEIAVIRHDFDHDFSLGMLADLFGPGTTGILGGQPQNAPQTTYPTTNSGFLSAQENCQCPGVDASVMSYFKWLSMKVFHTLAANFVVCDAWHCDMPGHTAPNRAFMHCATTGDLGIDDNDDASLDPAPHPQGPQRVNRRTIFEQIQDAGYTWKMYWPGSNCDTDWLNEQVFSQQYTPSSPTQFNVTQVPIANLFKDLRDGTLPFYSFIMCWNDIGPDTSMHPASFVEPAENFLACIYNAFRDSQYWQNTLLVVNFDENGGMYDHKGVPATTPPDYHGSGPAPVSRWQWSPGGTVYSFDFSVLGLRTPVLLISPWLKPGICTEQYQNTSILRFLQDMLPTPDPEKLFLTERDRHAPSIAPVFDYANFGLSSQRAACPSNIPDYPCNPRQYPVTISCAQIRSDADPTAADLAAPPAPHLVKVTRKYLAGLPGHPDSGKPITRSFATVGDMRAYAKQRRDAALAYIRQKNVS